MNNSPEQNNDGSIDPLSQLRYEQLVGTLIDSIKLVFLNPANSDYIFDEVFTSTDTNQRLGREALLAIGCYLKTPPQLGGEVVQFSIIRDEETQEDIELAIRFGTPIEKQEEYRIDPSTKMVSVVKSREKAEDLLPSNEGHLGRLTLLKLLYCNLHQPISRPDAEANTEDY